MDMNERLLPGRIRSGWGVSILFLCLMALSGCCSHEAIRVNLIPRPAEMEVLSGYFQPGNTTVDRLTTVVVDQFPDGCAGTGRDTNLRSIARPVRLTAATQTGIFYGKRTLEQLMTDQGYSLRKGQRPAPVCLPGHAHGCIAAFLSEKSGAEDAGRNGPLQTQRIPFPSDR